MQNAALLVKIVRFKRANEVPESYLAARESPTLHVPSGSYFEVEFSNILKKLSARFTIYELHL